jgi:hypothetical protein
MVSRGSLFIVGAVRATFRLAAVRHGNHIHSDRALFQVAVWPGRVGSDDFLPRERKTARVRTPW